jgi:dynein regulatory complex protein 1
MDRKFRQKNLELTEEYKRITEQYKELQTKFKAFQDRDRRKYKEIWSMNEERAAELIQKLLQADHIITEQQLHIKWEPPAKDLFAKEWEFDATATLSVMKSPSLMKGFAFL